MPFRARRLPDAGVPDDSRRSAGKQVGFRARDRAATAGEGGRTRFGVIHGGGGVSSYFLSAAPPARPLISPPAAGKRT